MRDTTAARGRTKKRMADRHRAAARQLVAPALVEARPAALGGPSLERDGGGWRCTECRRRSSMWHAIARERCGGSAAARWAAKAVQLAQHGAEDGGGHSRWMSGDVIWCNRCGAYAVDLARGLAKPCPGPPPPQGNSGGRAHQLRRLRAGRHLVTGACLPHHCPEPGWPGAARTDDVELRRRAAVHPTPFLALSPPPRCACGVMGSW